MAEETKVAEPKPAAEGPVRVIQLKAENFRRLKAVRIRPKETGVTRVYGKNGAGKSSVLDAIAAALGGKPNEPDAPIKKGSKKAEVVVDLDTLVVYRKWESGKTVLEVRNKEGAVFGSPQAVLDRLLGDLTFDPLQFARAKPAEQATTLAQAAGVDLVLWQANRKKVFDERTVATRAHKDAIARLRSIPEVDAPDKEVSIAELAKQLQEVNERNQRYEESTRQFREHQKDEARAKGLLDAANGQVRRAEEALAVANQEQHKAAKAYDAAVAETIEAGKVTEATPRADPAPVQKALAEAEAVNKLVRAKQDRKVQVEAAYAVEQKVDDLTAAIKKLDEERDAAVAAAALPVPGLRLAEDGVVYNDLPLGAASAAEQLRVSAAVGFKLNPKLKLLLVKDGSLLDEQSLVLLAEMAEAAGAQVIVERVENPGEVGVHIVDGEVAEEGGAA